MDRILARQTTAPAPVLKPQCPDRGQPLRAYTTPPPSLHDLTVSAPQTGRRRWGPPGPRGNPVRGRPGPAREAGPGPPGSRGNPVPGRPGPHGNPVPGRPAHTGTRSRAARPTREPGPGPPGPHGNPVPGRPAHTGTRSRAAPAGE